MDIFSCQHILSSLNLLPPQAVRSQLQLKILGFLLQYALITVLTCVLNLCIFSEFLIVVLFGGYKTSLQL